MTIAELIQQSYEDFMRRVEGNHPRGILKSDFEEVALTLVRKAAEGSTATRRVDITDPFLQIAIADIKAMANPQGSPDAFMPRSYTTEGAAVAVKDQARRYIRANIKGDGTFPWNDILNALPGRELIDEVNAALKAFDAFGKHERIALKPEPSLTGSLTITGTTGTTVASSFYNTVSGELTNFGSSGSGR